MFKKFRPVTPGTRQLVLLTHAQLTREGVNMRATVKPTKSLMLPKRRTNGRNNNVILLAVIKAEAISSITA